jgi:hypothetical protein
MYAAALRGGARRKKCGKEEAGVEYQWKMPQCF